MHAVDRPGRHRQSSAYIMFCFHMLEAYQAVGIPRWSQTKCCQPALQAFTSVPEVTKKMATAAKVTEQQAKDWLKKQAIWQIYLPAPRHIPRPKFDVAVPNEVHQADLLFLAHDSVRRKPFRYALTVFDVASRYKEAEPLTSKTVAEVADGLARIYKRSPLRWPKLLQVDPGCEFMGSVSQLLAKHSVQVRRGWVDTKASWSASTGRWLNTSSSTSMPRR